jgi:hypothetical protein
MGHDAWSCDILPSESLGNHLQGGDIMIYLDHGWDLMIAHPPCTDLAVSGARHFAAKRADGRQQRSIEFFMALAESKIPKKCIENPVSIMSTLYRKPDQIIQPWMFGHEETKSTCLWLTGLPLLKPTQIMEVRNRNLTPSGQNKLGPSPDRWKIRSKTYGGIAEAMAAQWGS